MNEQNPDIPKQSEAQLAPALLLPYQKPELRVYGAVRDLTLGSGTVTGDSGAHSMPLSDRTLKENIVRVGDHPLGFGLYLFDFKPEFHHFCPAGRQFGVMADEVLPVCPEAVGYAHGYRAVDYDRLGIVRPVLQPQ